MNTRIVRLILLIALPMLYASCAQDEGFGGKCHVKGKLIERAYDKSFTVQQWEQAAKDEDVFLLSGNETIIGDKERTSYTGEFEFNYLWPGDYKIFYYSEIRGSTTGEKEEVVIEFELKDNGTTDLDSLIIYKTVDMDEGNCHVKGMLIERAYDKSFTVQQWEQAAKDEDVFLLFGDETVIGDKESTSHTGEFEFNYLWPGDYKILYYSEDPDSITGENAEVIVEFTLKDNETKDLDSLILFNTIDIDDGNSTITGKIMLTNFVNGMIKDVTPAQEKEVYLVYGDNLQYDERIRTNYDGTFAFTCLIKGEYLVYVYSEDLDGGTEDFTVKNEVIIDGENQVFDLGVITINKR